MSPSVTLWLTDFNSFWIQLSSEAQRNETHQTCLHTQYLLVRDIQIEREVFLKHYWHILLFVFICVDWYEWQTYYSVSFVFCIVIKSCQTVTSHHKTADKRIITALVWACRTSGRTRPVSLYRGQSLPSMRQEPHGLTAEAEETRTVVKDRNI